MWYAVVRLGTQFTGTGFPQYMAKHPLNFGRAPDPSGDRGDMPVMVPWCDGGVCRPMSNAHQTLSLFPLYSDSPLSSRPQPKGVTETSLLARTQGRTFFIFRHHVLQGGSLCVVAKCATRLRWLRWPRGRARWRNNATLRVGSPRWSSGGTTRNIRAPPAGRPSRGTAGSNPRTGGHQPKDWQALFLTLTCPRTPAGWYLAVLRLFMYSWLSSLLPRSRCSVSSIPGLCRHF